MPKDIGVPKYSGVPKDKKEIVSQDTFIESLLPTTKVTFDDIFQMDDMENSQNLTKISEKSNYTEVEITLPNKSKVAQLYTDIDWLALSDSDDAQPMKSVSPKIRHKEVKRKHSSLSKGALITGTENKVTASSDQELSSLNKVITNLPDKYKHVCDINISSPSNGSMISDNPKTLNSKSKIEEVYIYPKKPINTSELEPVIVSNAKPSKVDEQLNLQTSNNLLDLIAKTMGIIPELAKHKFEKSVVSLLTTARSPSDTSEINNSESVEDSKVIIMNSTLGADDFTSDITVIDEQPHLKNDIPERVGNDHVIRPSNFCNVSSFVTKPSDLVSKVNTSSQLFTFSNLVREPEDLTKHSSVDNLSNRTTHDKTVRTTVSENYNKDGRLLASPIRYSATNLDVKSNCIANRRRSPRPPNIVANDLTHLDVFNHGSKDDIVNALSDQESPTLVTNFDFEKYAEHLKEETFYTTEPLSPIRPVSLTPSYDQTLKDDFDVKSPPKCNYSSPGTTVITRNVDLLDLTSPQKDAQKSEVFLKPLAIDCSQNKEDESYICDISPPLEGPTQNISPVDLAKVATAKMTNELILKSQGFGQGLLQMSNNRPMHSPNIAFLPQKNAQLYVSPKLFNPVDQHERSQDNICRNRSQESFVSPKVQSPFEGNLGGVQFVDIHLNTYNQNPVSSPKSNFHDRRNSSGSTLNIDSWDKRQNAIVSPSFNQGKPPHTLDPKDLHVASPPFTQVKSKQNVERRDIVSPTYGQIRPKNVNERQINERQDASKQKPRHSVNILRSYNKPQERRQNLQQAKTNSNPSHQHSSLMSQAFNMPEKAQTVINSSSKSTGFLTCDTQQQDAILDMLDKSDKSPNHFVSGMLTSSSNETFQFQRIHPKFASHQRRQVQTPEKPIPTCSKSNMDNFPGFQQNEAMLLNSRMATEQSRLKTKSKFESVSKIPQQEITRTSSASKEQVPKKTNVPSEILQRVPPQQEALMLNSRISAEQLRHRSNLSNINRSRSFDQPSVKNDFAFHTVSENSVICSPTINPSCNYSNAPKGSVFDYKNSLKSVEQKQNQGLACTISSRIDYTSHINDNERFNIAQVQRQLSAPSNLGNKSRTLSTNIVPNPDYEDVSSPEEVEVYPTTPRAKEIPQKTLPPYRLENETLSLHSVDKGQSSPQVSIPHSYNFKSSLESQVQYREQRSLLESGNRMFPEQRAQRQQAAFYPNMPSRHVQKNREVFETPVQFSEFCPNADISDSILDNI